MAIEALGRPRCAVLRGARLRVFEEDARAQALADDLGKRFPEDTIVQFNYLPTLRAKLALNRGNASEAIESLRAAAPYELGVSDDASPFGWTALYPVFVRGEAYLAAHQGSEAAAEFQKILDHPGIVLNNPSEHSRVSARPRLCVARRHRQGQSGISGFPYALERRGP